VKGIKNKREEKRMQIYDAQAQEVGSVSVKTAKISGALSEEFLKTLQGQMIGWVQAISDSKITQAEMATINSGGDVSALTEDTGVEGIYKDAAAYLYATTKINDITNVMNFMMSFMSIQKQLEDKVASLFTYIRSEYAFW